MSEVAERSMTLLNEMGDIEITWDSEHDDSMREVIAKKMKEGVTFFILKPLIGSYVYRKTQLKTVSDLKEHRVKIADADLASMFSAGKIAMFRSPSGEIDATGGRAKTATDVVKNRTVGVKALQGG
jgi:hypothetical protein